MKSQNRRKKKGQNPAIQKQFLSSFPSFLFEGKAEIPLRRPVISFGGEGQSAN